MFTVTDINKRRRSLMAVTLFPGIDFLPEEEKQKSPYSKKMLHTDESGNLLLDAEFLQNSGIAAGKMYDEETLLRFIEESDYKRASSRALWFLTRRDFCRAELYKKLALVFSEEVSQRVAEHMRDIGLVNDEEYARRLAIKLLHEKKISAKQAVYQISQKGIDKDIALSAVEEDAPNARLQIRELIEKKYRNSLSDDKGIKRVVSALARRGFSYGDIRSAMERFTSLDDTDYDI